MSAPRDQWDEVIPHSDREKRSIEKNLYEINQNLRRIAEALEFMEDELYKKNPQNTPPE